MGVIRHADAGYDIAKDVARQHRLDLKRRVWKNSFFHISTSNLV